MPEAPSATETIGNEVIALRHLLTQFMSSYFATMGQSPEQFDAFARHVREGFGITKPDAPGAEAAGVAIPAVLARLDALMAEVRRGLPG